MTQKRRAQDRLRRLVGGCWWAAAMEERAGVCAEIPQEFGKNLRACWGCHLVKTADQVRRCRPHPTEHCSGQPRKGSAHLARCIFGGVLDHVMTSAAID